MILDIAKLPCCGITTLELEWSQISKSGSTMLGSIDSSKTSLNTVNDDETPVIVRMHTS